ncbi:MAG TPA: heme o synthase [Pirellulales bacterium]|nr:heme o synthase [Pirellulales bacterium]
MTAIDHLEAIVDGATLPRGERPPAAITRPAIVAPQHPVVAAPLKPSAVARKLAAYVELTKPKISVMVLVTVAVAMFVGSWGAPSIWLVLNTVLGTALVAASASAINQRLERDTDALMPRTAGRPLPSGRVGNVESLLFGGLTLAVGLAYLAIAANPLAAALGALTWIVYVPLYTPLKRRTPFNTVVGAVAGALPTLIGWVAVRGSLSISPDGGGVAALTLFLIVYLWQFPHFMAIAWIYRNEYSTAGLKMLTVVDPSGYRAGSQAVMAALALLPVSLVPVVQHHAGAAYFTATTILGLAYLGYSVLFCLRRDDISARRLLRASLIYLPILLALFVLVH